MKISIITLLIIFLTINSNYLNAQQNDKSLLWKISGNNLKKPSYLFGTIHIICITDFIWTDAMSNSFKDCDKVCFEMNLSDPNIIKESASAFFDKSGKQLKDYFTKDEYLNIKKYFKENVGIDIDFLKELKPFALQSFLISKIPDCSKTISYEDSLMKIAQNQKKEIIGIETVKEQIDALESISNDSIVNNLIKEINNISSEDKEYFKLFSAYKNQDLPLINSILTQSDIEPIEMKALLIDRNTKWIKRIIDSINVSSVFFAVGAAHLYGETGIIKLLKKQGYTLEPIK